MKTNIFQCEDYRSYLNEIIQESPRGFKTKLAAAMGCQAIYLIRALNGEAQITEEQAFRAAQFLELSENQTDFFMDLVRLSRAGDPKLIQYLKKSLRQKSEAMREVSQRVSAKNIVTSLETQVAYFSSWKPSVLHLATSSAKLRTDEAIAARFGLDLVEVKKIMNFLIEAELVTQVEGKYQFSGKSIHLPKESPMQGAFQKERRSLVARAFDKKSPNAVHFSSVFATSKAHQEEIRSELLAVIERSHKQLEHTASEELFVMAVDFSPLV